MTESQKWLILVALLLVVGFFYALSPILSPFLIAMALAYMGDPLADKLEEWGLSRTMAVSLCFVFLTLILVLVGVFLVPSLANQFRTLAEFGPVALERFETQFIPWLEAQTGLALQSIDWRAIGAEIDWKETGTLVTTTIKRITNSGFVLVAFVANLVLVPVVTFYLLRDWDVLVARVGTLIPRAYYGKIRELAQECHEILGAFIRGQLLVMLALGILYSVGLMLIGVRLGLLIGMLAGLASIVPYMGFVVGIVAALIAAFIQFHDVMHIVLVLVVFGIGQMIEGMVLTPLLVGDRIGLHPVAVIFAILAGGQLFGFIGILIALPVAAVIMVLLRHIHDFYKGSSLYANLSEEELEVEILEEMRQEDA